MTSGEFATIKNIIDWGKEQLALAFGEDANPQEAYFLAEKVFDFKKERYPVIKGQRPSFEKTEEYKRLLSLRLEGEPLQYILGEWEFYGLPFKVGKGVLIPRPETEELVDMTLSFIKGKNEPRVMDLCSGSGAIPVAVAKYNKSAEVYGYELSEEAIPYLKENIALNEVNVKLKEGDVFKIAESDLPKNYFDVITSNPPYIASEEIADLQSEVQREPRMALDGGTDGLVFYRFIAKAAKDYLKTGGKLIFEIGDDQAEALRAILEENNYKNIEILKDLFGNYRVAAGIK